MIFFNNFDLVLRIGFRDSAISWIEVFVTEIDSFHLLVIVTEDLVLDVAGVLYPLLFVYIC